MRPTGTSNSVLMLWVKGEIKNRPALGWGAGEWSTGSRAWGWDAQPWVALQTPGGLH